ncbi:aldo/keto reductase [Fimbriimonas ginsengisoli]|uniref:Aldo/keto reductase n=1 Tax=Fimbriimonas ginsengisoli Gsoil 348 TaxID=661478 RepID=A0A068NLU2_FIMGI|nr:aldo/keto reductase [Fimbriimonas ginsengisoli]AIE84387.1 Aldo/keto reductase [Fimbriimonas ginsengisoli Gsoil 348]
MERRAFGKTGLEVSVLGFGGSEIGFGDVAQPIIERLLNSAIDAGLNVVDTAECYGDGEDKIGRAISHRRDEFLLFTKCGHSSGFAEPDWDPAMLAKSIDRSLQRLRVDYVDLVQLHSCDESLLRQGDVIDVLRRAREGGKTRFIGYSGDRNNARYAVECGAFDALQTSVNIADQEAIELTLPLARDKGMGIIAKRPVANVAWISEPPVGSYPRTYWERLQELRYDFLQSETQKAVSIALSFTLGQPGICTAIVGTQNPDRWRQNAKSIASGALAAEEVAAIRDRWKEVARPDWVGCG